jgi:hypothetical protein
MNKPFPSRYTRFLRHHVFDATRVALSRCFEKARILRQPPRMSPLVAKNSGRLPVKQTNKSPQPQALRQIASRCAPLNTSPRGLLAWRTIAGRRPGQATRSKQSREASPKKGSPTRFVRINGRARIPVGSGFARDQAARYHTSGKLAGSRIPPRGGNSKRLP